VYPLAKPVTTLCGHALTIWQSVGLSAFLNGVYAGISGAVSYRPLSIALSMDNLSASRGQQMPRSDSDVPHQRQAYPPANRLASAQAWRRRVQFAVLLQIAEQGCADRETLASIVPGAGQRDLAAAVDDLLHHGLLHGPPEPRDSLDLLTCGLLLMTSSGRRWLDADVA
jgi:hypothetical protein